MLPVQLHVHISAPREEIYDLISDLGVRVAWCDNYQSEYRLAYPKSQGAGAGGRDLPRAPSGRNWTETMVVEADRPRRLVERTHGGRAGRSPGGIVWELESVGGGLTRVDVEIWSDAGTPRERFKEKLGYRGWLRRGAKGSLERLRIIFEEHPDRPL